MSQKAMKQSPATALVAHAQALSMQEPPPAEDLAALIGAVCADRAERAALLSALSRVNDRSARVIVTDLLRSYAVEQAGMSDSFGNRDAALGVWTQRLGAGLLLFGLGAVVAGTATGLAGAAAVAAPLLLLGASSWGRLWLLERKGRRRMLADQAEQLARSIGEIKDA